MSQGHVPLLRKEHIIIKLLRKLFIKPNAFVVKGHALGGSIIGTNDRRISPAVSGSQITLFQNGHIFDSTLSQVVGGSQPVDPGSDDDHIIGRL